MPKFIANQPIDINGVRAFATGNEVPEGHVERYQLQDLVSKEGTVEAVEAVEGFDPSSHDVPTVLEYLEQADGEEKARVLDLEADGKARKTILDQYEVTEADEPAQPAVEAGQASPVGDGD